MGFGLGCGTNGSGVGVGGRVGVEVGIGVCVLSGFCVLVLPNASCPCAGAEFGRLTTMIKLIRQSRLVTNSAGHL